jgi:hypothetical protein
VIIILIGSLFFKNVISNGGEELLLARPAANPLITEMGEIITFNGTNSQGTINLYEWNFGDGNISNGIEATHVYTSIGWFNVTLTIFSHSGKKANSTLVVGIQNRNTSDYYHTGFVKDIRPLHLWVGGWGNEVGPNIKNPNIEIYINFTRVIGSYQFRLYYMLRPFNTNPEIIEIELKSLQSRGENSQFYYKINSQDVPEIISSVYAGISVDLVLTEGMWVDASIDMKIMFPIDIEAPIP